MLFSVILSTQTDNVVLLPQRDYPVLTDSLSMSGRWSASLDFTDYDSVASDEF